LASIAVQVIGSLDSKKKKGNVFILFCFLFLFLFLFSFLILNSNWFIFQKN